jgi:hypothetical protein
VDVPLPLGSKTLPDLSYQLLTSHNCNFRHLKVKVTLRLAVYPQSVRLGAKPLEAHYKRLFFATELLSSQSLCNILSDEKMALSLMTMLGPSSSVRIAQILVACYWKFFLLHYIQVL